MTYFRLCYQIGLYPPRYYFVYSRRLRHWTRIYYRHCIRRRFYQNRWEEMNMSHTFPTHFLNFLLTIIYVEFFFKWKPFYLSHPLPKNSYFCGLQYISCLLVCDVLIHFFHVRCPIFFAIVWTKRFLYSFRGLKRFCVVCHYWMERNLSLWLKMRSCKNLLKRNSVFSYFPSFMAVICWDLGCFRK